MDPTTTVAVQGVVLVAFLTGVSLSCSKTLSVFKSALAKDWNTPVTQVVMWLIAGVAITLLNHASLTTDAVIPGLNVTFGSLDAASLCLMAWIIGGTGSFLFDFRKVFDQHQTAAEPTLLAPVITPPVVGVVVNNQNQ